jgi:hypothetical protein
VNNIISTDNNIIENIDIPDIQNSFSGEILEEKFEAPIIEEKLNEEIIGETVININPTTDEPISLDSLEEEF